MPGAPRQSTTSLICLGILHHVLPKNLILQRQELSRNGRKSMAESEMEQPRIELDQDLGLTLRSSATVLSLSFLLLPSICTNKV